MDTFPVLEASMQMWRADNWYILADILREREWKVYCWKSNSPRRKFQKSSRTGRQRKDFTISTAMCTRTAPPGVFQFFHVRFPFVYHDWLRRYVTGHRPRSNDMHFLYGIFGIPVNILFYKILGSSYAEAYQGNRGTRPREQEGGKMWRFAGALTFFSFLAFSFCLGAFKCFCVYGRMDLS
ncbi:hypothetical protein CEXT_549921 [Caerostris extrusa]|uniref:Uncharacterized protein n=1 Tax=Caerostris extrusa TaxID=172846 RepID=A0AAV4N8B4_CAEEX|nr:hypothetical protein CEXT_549921 [Caerostris extrusa]